MSAGASEALTKPAPGFFSTIGQAIYGWFGGNAGALGERRGQQVDGPARPTVDGLPSITVDTALQQAMVWACVDRRASVIASLPFDVFRVSYAGKKTSAPPTDRLVQLLCESPNSRMTPFDFWRAIMLNHDFRGNGYARIDRDASSGEAVSLWPMPADQCQTFLTEDGALWLAYTLFNDTYIFAEEDFLHLKGLGNGTTGLDKLAFMRPSISEGMGQAQTASKLFYSGGKPAAVLMTDKVLTPAQRRSLQDRFVEITDGNRSRLFVLEADVKYQQISATPEQLQLLEQRKATGEDICRYFDVPPLVVYAGDQTAWGTGIDSIIEAWHKFTIGPICESIEQAVRKRVMTSAQRASMCAEFNLDALLRGTPKTRFEIYASASQNGILSRDEIRGLENWPAMGGKAAVLTVQSAQIALDDLGKQQQPPPGAGGDTGDTPPQAQ